MDSTLEAVILQNLEEFVFDENKVVTCKWLSSTFSLHINYARQLLDKFLCKHADSKNGKSINKTFYVSGIHKDGKGLMSSIIKEEELISFKNSLSVVLSEQIFSIQSGGVLCDLALLYITNQSDEPCKGALKNYAISKRSLEELAALRVGTYSNVKNPPSVNTNSKPVNALSSIKKKENDSHSKVETKIDADEPKNTVENKPCQNSVNNKPAKKVGGIAGFFSKQAAVPKISNAISKAESKQEKNQNNGDLKQEPPPPIGNSVNKEKISPLKTTKQTDNAKDNDSGSKEKAVNTAIKKQVNASVKKQADIAAKKQVNTSKKDQGKKRKRIQVADSDSDDDNKVEIDDIFAADSPEPAEKPQLSDDEDVIPLTPEVKVNKAPLNPRKRKKIVDKTFMDDNGYIITKKEEIYESCSDSNDEPDHKTENVPLNNNVKSAPKPQNKKPTISPAKGKKKASPVKQGKQQSLMNFFKKI